MSALILVFEILILSVLACLFGHRPDPAFQTDHNRKHAARGLLIKSTSQLVLFIIAALLAFVLVFLASFGGHDDACRVVLSISLTCVNGSQLTLLWFLMQSYLPGWLEKWSHSIYVVVLLLSILPLIG